MRVWHYTRFLHGKKTGLDNFMTICEFGDESTEFACISYKMFTITKNEHDCTQTVHVVRKDVDVNDHVKGVCFS
jgi:hypothetical protein